MRTQPTSFPLIHKHALDLSIKQSNEGNALTLSKAIKALVTQANAKKNEYHVYHTR